MERHNSVNLLVFEGSTVEVTRMMLASPPPRLRKIIVKNAQLTKDAFGYIMQTYEHVELLNVTIYIANDDTDFEGCLCLAKSVHMPASLMMHVSQFVECKKLQLFLDISCIDRREEHFEYIQTYGTIKTAREYMETYRNVADAFSRNHPDTISIRLDVAQH